MPLSRPLSRRVLLQAIAIGGLAGCAGRSNEPASTVVGAASRAASAPVSGSASATPGTAGTAGTAASRPRGPAREVRHGDRTRRAVALTFHGAGDAALARSILAELSSGGAHASVLAVGTWLRDHPEMARRILDAGHDLGNHTLNHRPMRRLGAGPAYDEIVGCARILRTLTGSQGTWFRASGTQQTNTTIRAAAGRAGYGTCVSYDVDGLDWRDPASQTVVSAVLGSARNGSIISLHLGHAVTLTALPLILDDLRRRRLTPVTLTELLT